MAHIIKFKNANAHLAFKEQKIHIIKALRDATCHVDCLGNRSSRMGLKEAKDIVDVLVVDGQIDFTEWAMKVNTTTPLEQFSLVVVAERQVCSKIVIESLKVSAKEHLDKGNYEAVKDIMEALLILTENV